MTFRQRIQYFLVRKLQISNKDALTQILAGEVKINGETIKSNREFYAEDEISLGEIVLKASQEFHTYAYYKPRGIECTLNPIIPDNLKEILPFNDEFFPIGRLDKASEGLLLITNDGRLYDKILRKEFEIEKEYLVRTDKVIDEEFIQKMSGGIKIMGKITLPCLVEKVDDFSFRIVLIQGLNRQIRRMCYKLAYEVTELKRVRIGNIKLENLTPNASVEITSHSIF